MTKFRDLKEDIKELSDRINTAEMLNNTNLTAEDLKNFILESNKLMIEVVETIEEELNYRDDPLND